MSMRSPNNERTLSQQNGTATGMTKKGASSMKPARQVAGSVRAAAPGAKGRAKKDPALMTKSERDAQKRAERDDRDRRAAVANILRDRDPKFLAYRRVWWALLGGGVALTVVSWCCMFVFPGSSQEMTDPMGIAAIVTLVLAYASIIGGFIFDMVRIRPIRRRVDAEVDSMTEKKKQALIDEAYVADLEKKAAKQACRK